MKNGKGSKEPASFGRRLEISRVVRVSDAIDIFRLAIGKPQESKNRIKTKLMKRVILQRDGRQVSSKNL